MNVRCWSAGGAEPNGRRLCFWAPSLRTRAYNMGRGWGIDAADTCVCPTIRH